MKAYQGGGVVEATNPDEAAAVAQMAEKLGQAGCIVM